MEGTVTISVEDFIKLKESEKIVNDGLFMLENGWSSGEFHVALSPSAQKLYIDFQNSHAECNFTNNTLRDFCSAKLKQIESGNA